VDKALINSNIYGLHWSNEMEQSVVSELNIKTLNAIKCMFQKKSFILCDITNYIKLHFIQE